MPFEPCYATAYCRLKQPKCLKNDDDDDNSPNDVHDVAHDTSFAYTVEGDAPGASQGALKIIPYADTVTFFPKKFFIRVSLRLSVVFFGCAPFFGATPLAVVADLRVDAI